jgi:hypothetical protein
MEKQPRENKKEIVMIYFSEKDNKIFEIAIVLNIVTYYYSAMQPTIKINNYNSYRTIILIIIHLFFTIHVAKL